MTESGGDPPPPYGPPTYEQAVNDEVKEGGAEEVTEADEEEEGEGSQVSHNSGGNMTPNRLSNVSNTSCYNGTMTVSHHEYNLDGEQPQEHQPTFQDLPSVTL